MSDERRRLDLREERVVIRREVEGGGSFVAWTRRVEAVERIEVPIVREELVVEVDGLSGPRTIVIPLTTEEVAVEKRVVTLNRVETRRRRYETIERHTVVLRRETLDLGDAVREPE